MFPAGQVRSQQSVRATPLATEISNMVVQRGAAVAIDHARSRLLDLRTVTHMWHSPARGLANAVAA
jgi:hypothetical protein